MLTPPHLLTALFLFPVCADRICPDAPSGYPGSIPSEDHFRINVVQGYAPSLSYASSILKDFLKNIYGFRDKVLLETETVCGIEIMARRYTLMYILVSVLWYAV